MQTTAFEVLALPLPEVSTSPGQLVAVLHAACGMTRLHLPL